MAARSQKTGCSLAFKLRGTGPGEAQTVLRSPRPHPAQGVACYRARDLPVHRRGITLSQAHWQAGTPAAPPGPSKATVGRLKLGGARRMKREAARLRLSQ